MLCYFINILCTFAAKEIARRTRNEENRKLLLEDLGAMGSRKTTDRTTVLESESSYALQNFGSGVLQRTYSGEDPLFLE